MRLLPACTLSALLIAGCSGGSAGPTSPREATNVAGTWKGNAVTTITTGPACLTRQPTMGAAMVQISQNGAAISGTFANCSFHGTVTDTTISWTQDAQQAIVPCLVTYPMPCISMGGVELIFVRSKTSSIVGTVSGTAMSASGSSTDDVVNPTTGQAIGTLQETVQLTLRRQ